MSIATGKVISVSMNVDYPKKDGGSYPAWVLSYVNSFNEKKDLVKHMNSLRFGPGPKIKAALQDLKPGDPVSIAFEKKGEFNEVVDLVKGEPTVEMAANTATETSGASASGSVRSGKVLGSNYETPEERKTKQRLIVRQSSFTQAREFNPKAKIEDIFNTAEQIEGWVYRGLDDSKPQERS